MTRFIVWTKSCLYMLVGLSLAMACWSYHPEDPSWNTAGETVRNVLGPVGSIIADLMWQGLGLMAPVVIAACFMWGICLIRGKGVRGRIGLLLLVVLLGCWLEVGNGQSVTECRYLPAGAGGFIGFYLGRWGIFSNLWIRLGLWLVWAVMATVALALPVRYILMRIIQKAPMLARLIPVLKRAERAVEPLKKIKIRKKAAPPKTPVKVGQPIAPTTAYRLPSPDLLTLGKANSATISKDMISHISRALEAALAQFGITGKIVGAKAGPVATLYEFEPAEGIKASRVIALADDIALKMSAMAVRIAVVPGSNVIGIEMPNPKRETVFIRTLIESAGFKACSGALPLILGKDIGGKDTFADLAKMPHLLVAGTTGSGKSVAINTMILSLLYRFTPEECRLILVDPKVVELSIYNHIPHLLTPVVTEPPKAVVALKWAVREMEDRYRAMSELNVKTIESYNQKLRQAATEGRRLTRRVQTGFDPTTGRPIIEEQPFDLTPFPYIVMIVDEMSDLMGQCGKEAEPPILRLAQKARAVGIHLILATQRPSVDVITGLIKANFPTRISFQVTNKIDSRTILDEQGAEQLLGHGDMLYRPAGSKPIRLQGPFVDEDEIKRVADFWRDQGTPKYVSAVITDTETGDSGAGDTGGEATAEIGEGNLYDQAVAIILRDKKVSTSYIQRQLRIGYNRAADLIDRMEREGVISKPNIAGKREILVPTDNA